MFGFFINVVAFIVCNLEKKVLKMTKGYRFSLTKNN